MIIEQKTLTLKPRRRGFHLITGEVEQGLPELERFRRGLAHLLLQHTSAALSLNENADPDVRRDMETIMNGLIPEGFPGLLHTMEGRDDMPAHAKSALLGSSLTLPVSGGGFTLGTWQGLYLCEHRNRASARRLVVTIIGEE